METIVDTSSSTSTEAESSKEQRDSVLGLLLFYGIGAALVIVLGMV